MLTAQSLLDHVKAEPFRPFRIQMASGRALDIQRPEMIKVLRGNLLIFRSSEPFAEIPDDWESVPLALVQSVTVMEASRD